MTNLSNLMSTERLAYWDMQLSQIEAKHRIESEDVHDFSQWGYNEIMVLNKNLDVDPFWSNVGRAWLDWYMGTHR